MTTKPEEIALAFKPGVRVIGWDESALCSWHAKPGVVEGPGVTEERVVVRMDHGVTLTFHVSNLRLDDDPARGERFIAVANPPAPGSWYERVEREFKQSIEGQWLDTPPRPAAKASDPYEQHREKLKVKFHVASESNASLETNIARRVCHDDEVTGRRARLIAALAAEQRDGEAKSILLKHPAEGRSERALPVSNGGK